MASMFSAASQVVIASTLTPFDPPAHLAYVIKYKKASFMVGGVRYVVKTWTVRSTTNRQVSSEPPVFKIARGGPDDQTYINHPELLVRIPRVFSELFVIGHDEELSLLHSLQGMPKFGGLTVADEDDKPFDGATDKDAEAAISAGMTDMKMVKQWGDDDELIVSAQEKANGKCLGFALVTVGDVLILFGGSKNMHIPVIFGEPIIGNDLHHNILRAISADLQKLDPKTLSSIVGKNIIGEYVDNMHIVFVPNVIPTQEAVPFCVYFNCDALPQPRLLIPVMNRLPTPAELAQIRGIETIDGNLVEGCVTIMRNTRTGQTFRNKWKTNMYIILRCWREMMHPMRSDTTQPEVISALYERTCLRSKQFLNLSADDLVKYKTMIEQFVEWFFTTNYSFKDVHPFSSVGMAKIWHQFTHQTCVCHYCVNHPWLTMVSSVPAAGSDVPAAGSATVSPLADSPLAKSFLAVPKYYDLIIAAAQRGFGVVVCTIGAPGSGKSTFAKLLQADLTSMGISCDTFTTDDEFVEDGKYNFNPKLLGVHHATNLRKFRESKAQVRINANTNLNPSDYAAYIRDGANKGNICMVLAMALTSTDVLDARNIHGVPKKKIDEMNAKAFIRGQPAPMYEGIFITKEELKNAFDEHKYEHIEPTQEAPLHITVNYVGGAKNRQVGGAKNRQVDERFGTSIGFNIIGRSTHIAGIGLVVIPNGGVSGNHITLTTNDGFKPVDVGTNITEANTVKFPSEMSLVGLFLPMW